jgi:hypothetical protein
MTFRADSARLARARSRPVPSPRSNETLVKGSARRAPVLVALTHEVLNAGRFETIADVAEQVKRDAARLGIPYTGDQVAVALRSVGSRRQLCGLVRRGSAR